MTDINPLTGLPTPPVGMYWKVAKHFEDGFYSTYYDPSIPYDLILMRKEKRVLGLVTVHVNVLSQSVYDDDANPAGFIRVANELLQQYGKKIAAEELGTKYLGTYPPRNINRA